MKELLINIKKWSIRVFFLDTLFHYIFGLWAGLFAMILSRESIYIFISTLIVAVGKETYDCWLKDWKNWKVVFSFRDIKNTIVGGITILIFNYFL